jgi:hypothetical protein
VELEQRESIDGALAHRLYQRYSRAGNINFGIGLEIDKLVNKRRYTKVAKSVAELIEVIDREVVIPVVTTGHGILDPDKAVNEVGWEALWDMRSSFLVSCLRLPRALLVIVRHVLNAGMSIKSWNHYARN